ncbi:MAG: GTPase HflX [Planctomycetota bacterium]
MSERKDSDGLREDPREERLAEASRKLEEAVPSGVLFSLAPDRGEEDPFEELRGLCRTAGIEPVAELLQVRRSPSPSLYLGKGKVEELEALAKEHRSALVVCDEELSPVQGRNLERALELRVMDRSELILRIFAQRARTAQARIQVELAQRQYELPRLKRLWTHLDRESGGRGALGGMGERQIEIDRRILKRRISSLRRRLVEIEARKQREILSRRREFTVSLVGYTNAGKSTLMNLLTGADQLEEDRLFATLDTRTRRWQLGEGRYALLSDTVGFIRKLPLSLVASFHATLAEAREADLLLAVVDLTRQRAEEQLETVLDVLEETGAGGKDWLPVLNKIDALADRSLLPLLERRYEEATVVSARTGEGREKLTAAVLERMDRVSEPCRLAVLHRDSALISTLRELATVLDVSYGREETVFDVRISPAARQFLESRGVRLVGEE